MSMLVEFKKHEGVAKNSKLSKIHFRCCMPDLDFKQYRSDKHSALRGCTF